MLSFHKNISFLKVYGMGGHIKGRDGRVEVGSEKAKLFLQKF